MCARSFLTRLAGEDYTAHIDEALFRIIVAAYQRASKLETPLKMPHAKMLQIAQYVAALPWMMGVARQADSMQSAFVQCGFRDVPAGTRPSLKGIMNTLVRACAGCARIVERVRIVIVREWASPVV